MHGLTCSEPTRCKVCQWPGSLLGLLKCEDDKERADRRQARLIKDIPLELPRWDDLSAEEQAAAPKPDEHTGTSEAEWRRMVKSWVCNLTAVRKARMDPRRWLDGDFSRPAKDPPLPPGVYQAGRQLCIAVDRVHVAPGGGCRVTLGVQEVVENMCGCPGW